MQIFLISKSNKKSVSLTLGPSSLCLLSMVVVISSVFIFYAGNQFAIELARDNFKSIYAQATPMWSKEMEAQQAVLDQTKENAEKTLDALASRLSKLQAHVMRLDAVGSRLADMAHLNEIEFDITDTPGLGGPIPQQELESIQVNDFMTKLEQLSAKIQDRSEKLAAIESMLIDRTLRNETMPTGRPTQEGWISSLFGMRTDPITGKVEYHAGVDYTGKIGSPILAVASGIVTWSGVHFGYGNVVEINHGNGYLTRYAHNKKNLVVVGEKVEKGKVIALMGSTGRSTGSHVHFEVINNGKTVDPEKYISLN